MGHARSGARRPSRKARVSPGRPSRDKAGGGAGQNSPVSCDYIGNIIHTERSGFSTGFRSDCASSPNGSIRISVCIHNVLTENNLEYNLVGVGVWILCDN